MWSSNDPQTLPSRYAGARQPTEGPALALLPCGLGAPDVPSLGASACCRPSLGCLLLVAPGLAQHLEQLFPSPASGAEPGRGTSGRLHVLASVPRDG